MLLFVYSYDVVITIDAPSDVTSLITFRCLGLDISI